MPGQCWDNAGTMLCWSNPADQPLGGLASSEQGILSSCIRISEPSVTPLRRIGRRPVACSVALWHDAAMPPQRKKPSKFDQAALEIAEGIANIPVQGKKQAIHLLREIENKKEVPRRTKKLSTKSRTEMKRKSSHAKRKHERD